MTDIATFLHACYCEHSGQQITLTMPRIYAWEAWKLRGWTEKDLVLCLRYVAAEIQGRRKWPGAIQFRNLIERPEIFEEELSTARATSRVKRTDSGLDDVKRATGRIDADKATEKPVGQILREGKLFRELLAREGL